MRDINPSKYPGNLDFNEIFYIIQLSCRLRTIEQIIDDFSVFSPDKPLTGKTIREIQLDHAQRITREASIYRSNVEGSPLAHERLVLDMFMELWDSTRVERETVMDRETGQWKTAPDDANSAKVLKMATDYLISKEKLKLEQLKRAQAVLPVHMEDVEEETEETAAEPSIENSWELS